MKLIIFLAILMVSFFTIEVQGNQDEGVDNRKIWFGEKMDEFLAEINKQRKSAGKEARSYNKLKKMILASGNLQALFKNDYNKNNPSRIVGN